MSSRTLPSRADESPVALHALNKYFLKAGGSAYAHLKASLVSNPYCFRYIGDILVQESRFIQKIADYKLYQQHATASAAIANPFVVVISADTHRWHQADERLETYLGYSLSELEADWIVAYHPEDCEAIDEEVTKVFRDLHEGTRSYAEAEVRYQTRVGYSVWAQLTFSLVRDWEGRPEYFMVVIRDISMVKWTELFYNELAALKALVEICEEGHESLACINGLMQHYDGKFVEHGVIERIQGLLADD